jgi:hydrogenase expression/formation protein HypC
MCVAVPGKVVAINNQTAVLSFMGVEKEVSTELLNEIKVGDYLLVHAGCAIQKLDPNEAEETIKLFEELRESI